MTTETEIVLYCKSVGFLDTYIALSVPRIKCFVNISETTFFLLLNNTECFKDHFEMVKVTKLKYIS